MIVQSAPEGATNFVIRMTEHTAFAGKLARAFGNDDFEPLAPRAEMLFVVDHHDQGWVPFDADPEIDPETGLPYHLTSTPRKIAIRTGDGSADFNEAHHPYSGLLSSMHIWGLYNGRYGYSDQVLLGAVPEDWRPRYEAMLDGHLARQERLRAQLAGDPATAGWVEDDHLFQNYKQLQFFDTLALYFHCAHDGARRATDFKHVPKSAAEDVTVSVAPAGPGVYSFDPYPWCEDGLVLTFEGRYMAPVLEPATADGAALMRSTPAAEQAVTFVRG
jgi:hypothetical protein